MSVISVEMMKTIDQTEMQKDNKIKTKTERSKGTEAVAKG